MNIRLLDAACLCCSAIASGQASVNPKAYNVEQAYQINSLLLPSEESYSFAEGTLIIRQETANQQMPHECVTTDVAGRPIGRFSDAIADYNRVNREQWLLQRQFHIEKPYEIVSSDSIELLFKDGFWESFYKRYPKSGGYIVMSAVGFNKERDRAVVYTGSSCGGLCGQWQFNLLEKVHGKWKVAGMTCFAQS